MKPIDTEFMGYRFRSRLEARWAVFFVRSGVRFTYEAEGYRSDDGESFRYLPDFYLPDWKAFVEVKPNHDLHEDDISKVVGFVREGGAPVYVTCGDPLDVGILYIRQRGFVDGAAAYPYCAKHPKAGKFISAFPPINRSDLLPHDGECPIWHRASYDDLVAYVTGGPEYKAAVAARSARFEFGETPK